MRIKNTAAKICVFTIGLIFASASFAQNSTGRDSTRSLTGKDSTDIFPLIGTLPTANTIVFTAPTYTAPRVQGICGSDNNATVYTTPTGLCSSGIPSSVTFNGSTYNWSCSGQWGGNNSSCSAVPPPVQGICGSDNATTVYSTPTRLCSSGTPSTVSFNGSTYSWSCSGKYGGSNRSCSAAQYVPPPPPEEPYLYMYTVIATYRNTGDEDILITYAYRISTQNREGPVQRVPINSTRKYVWLLWDRNCLTAAGLPPIRLGDGCPL